MKTILISAAIAFGFVAGCLQTQGQGTAFTYQGSLSETGSPVSGVYDLQFALFDAATAGTQQSGTWTQLGCGVTNGRFTVVLDFGNFFPGAARWLEIGARTNGAVAFTTLNPRQQITATPYAVRAGSLSGVLPLAQLPAGVVTNAADGVNLTGTFSGNGAGLTNVNAATVTGLSPGSLWRTNGNIGANPTNGAFLGTTDNLPLELRVKNQRAWRLEPTAAPDTINVIGGSPRNSVLPGVVGATIGGGGSGDYKSVAYTNRVESNFGTVAGGLGNRILWDTLNFTEGQTISGGFSNTIGGATSSLSSIGGGGRNAILGAFSDTIGGGYQNTIQDWVDYSTIAGGADNTLFNGGFGLAIGGGTGNTIQPEAQWATIAGGNNNIVGNTVSYGTIGGGGNNQIAANGSYGTVPGGFSNIATNYAFAAGNRAKALHTGTFVWGDSTAADFASSTSNQFLVRASSGVGINMNNPQSTLHVNGTVRVQGANNWNINSVTGGGGEGDFRVGNDGYRFKIGVANEGGGAGDVYMRAEGGTARIFLKSPGGLYISSNEAGNAGVSLAPNGTSWGVISDRNVKKDFAAVDQREILEKLAAMPVTQWHYQWESSDATPHIGPMAQDFKAAFYPGTDDKSITTQEADGVALAAIQGLNQKLEAELKAKAERISDLERRLSALEALLNK